MDSTFLLFPILFVSLAAPSLSQMPGFVSINCGDKGSFTDEIGLQWTGDDSLPFGVPASIAPSNEARRQYRTLRYFPDDDRKYCYTLSVVARTRYLLRATFLYGNFDNNNVYPKFDISLGATHWSTIVISDANTIETSELIFLSSSPSIAICLSNAVTGKPFISTLELRQFNGSLYYTNFEDRFFLGVSARINFGAESEDPVRYPDDPFDRIWASDSVKKANYLVDVAAGTKRVSTKKPIDVSQTNERPPEKVMQTAVVGTNGSLSYRFDLAGFPGFGWAVTYFAEIEDLGSTKTRRFRLVLPGQPEMSKPVVDIAENSQGSYRGYEPGYPNVSLPFVLSFRFLKVPESSLGPLLNAMEICKYVEKSDGCVDGLNLGKLVEGRSGDWANEPGDPCLPVPWSWVRCSSGLQPMVAKIMLSSKNLTGPIPYDLTKLTGLIELWLDNNLLASAIPDFSGCKSLEIIHLENNILTGKLPSSLTNLPNLKELYVQNNKLSGSVPSGLITKNLVFNYSGNLNLRYVTRRSKTIYIIIGFVIGLLVLLLATAMYYLYHIGRRTKPQQIKEKPQETPEQSPVQRSQSSLNEGPADSAHCFTYLEIEEATSKFSKKIGSGGFGVVFYGKLKDEREIAVKVLSSSSYQGKREFANEITLLSRMHHRNLVQFLGCFQDDSRSMLIYEYLHNGTLKEHLQKRSLNWTKRLEIAEDAAKGIEYLHTGCVPSVIHRDLKSSNILLDKFMRAKVSDFGLSKVAVEGMSHVSSLVRGTVGYLDPEYYISLQLTEKSDVYSFGVILLELMSGREAISSESFGANCRNIVQWAKMHIESGDIETIVDPVVRREYDAQSMWKMAEMALMCVQPHGQMRPPMALVLKEIQDALAIERDAANLRFENGNSPALRGRENLLALDDSFARPSAR